MLFRGLDNNDQRYIASAVVRRESAIALLFVRNSSCPSNETWQQSHVSGHHALILAISKSDVGCGCSISSNVIILIFSRISGNRAQPVELCAVCTSEVSQFGIKFTVRKHAHHEGLGHINAPGVQ